MKLIENTQEKQTSPSPHFVNHFVAVNEDVVGEDEATDSQGVLCVKLILHDGSKMEAYAVRSDTTMAAKCRNVVSSILFKKETETEKHIFDPP